MQNSTFTRVEENEISRFLQLLQRIKIAYRLILNPKAIVIINNSIHSFQTTPEETAVICQQINVDVNQHLHQEEFVARRIKTLVYN